MSFSFPFNVFGASLPSAFTRPIFP